MTTVNLFDSVRTTVETAAIFSGRTIPAGTEGAVVEVFKDGACTVDFELDVPEGADPSDGFVQAELQAGQYEIVRRADG